MIFCFWFAVSSWGIHLSSFFTFPIYFKCQTTIEWSALSSGTTSCIVVRGAALRKHKQKNPEYWLHLNGKQIEVRRIGAMMDELVGIMLSN